MLDQAPEHLARHRRPQAGHEDLVAAAPCKQERARLGQIALQPVGGDLAERHQALLAALAHHAYHALIDAHREDLQADQLGDAQACGVEHLQHAAVAQALRGVEPGRGEQGLDLGLAQGLGKALGRLRGVDRQGGVLGDLAIGQQKAVVAPPRGDQAALAGRFRGAAELGEIGGEIRAADGGQALRARLQPGGEAGEVAAVAGQRVRRQPVLQPQRVGEAVELGAVRGLQAGLARRCASAHSAPSKASSQRLTSSSQPSRALAKPPSPAAEVTRWQGTIRGKGLAPQAWPTARGALPRLVASSP